MTEKSEYIKLVSMYIFGYHRDCFNAEIRDNQTKVVNKLIEIIDPDVKVDNDEIDYLLGDYDFYPIRSNISRAKQIALSSFGSQ